MRILHVITRLIIDGARENEGRRRFAHQFRHETMTSQLRSLYERLLDGPSRNGSAH